MKIDMPVKLLRVLILIFFLITPFAILSIAFTSGSLSVLSEPSGATVYLDNTEIGKTDIIVGAIPEGTHTVRVELAGYETVEKIVNVGSEIPTSITLVLVQKGGESPIGSKRVAPTTTTRRPFVEVINPWIALLGILFLAGMIILMLIIKALSKRRKPALKARPRRIHEKRLAPTPIRQAKGKASTKSLKPPIPTKGVSLKKTPIIGNYRVLKKIASGGMATIYKATHIKKGGTAVLKVPYEQFQNDRTFIERFRREAELGKKLHNENIIRIYENGTSKDGSTYIAMEYVPGIDLRYYLDRYGKMPIADALRMIVPVCRALDYAHAKGVIHRDIKPENIMLPEKEGRGRVVLMDFGVAHAAYLGTVGTQSTYLGTPFYMSPDQLSGQKVDGRSDIYSLGVVFFEMLTGRRPFDDPDPIKVLLQHRKASPPRPSSFNPKIPAALEKIVLKMLSKRPKDRYKNVESLLVALQEYMVRKGMDID